MGLFRKKLLEELDELISDLGKSTKFLSEKWIWKDSKLKGLKDLEELDLQLIRTIRKLHRLVKGNNNLYNQINFLAAQLKDDLDLIMKLKNLNQNVPKDKLELGEKILFELNSLLKQDIQDIRLIRGMTHKQVKELGIKLISFYTVQDKEGVNRIVHGKGTWPITPTKAHFGPGLYSFDDIKHARKYKKLITDRCKNEGIEIPKLHIVKVSFSKRSLEDFKPFDVDLLDSFEMGETEKWLNRHSSLLTDNKKVESHGKKAIIRGTGNFGKEHYFHPECLEEAVFDLVA